MNNRYLHKFLHEYDFPYHDYLLDNLSTIDKMYEENKIDALGNHSANVMFYSNDIWNFLNPKLNQIVTENYYVSPFFADNHIGIYKQTNNQDHQYPSHNHVSTTTIVGVFYINPPKINEGGELILHTSSVYSDYIKIIPQPNKLYLFPSWVYHHVSPQINPTPRYSLNWGYNSVLRPIHKLTGDLW